MCFIGNCIHNFVFIPFTYERLRFSTGDPRSGVCIQWINFWKKESTKTPAVVPIASAPAEYGAIQYQPVQYNQIKHQKVQYIQIQYQEEEERYSPIQYQKVQYRQIEY